MRPAGHVLVSPALEYGVRKVHANNDGWELDPKGKYNNLISR
jgi:hypothetical protein